MFKILHVKCRNHETSSALYTAAMSCGFRESGIGSNDLVAIRISLKLDAPLGYITDTDTAGEGLRFKSLVSDEYVEELDYMTKARFEENFRRRDQLMKKIQDTMFGLQGRRRQGGKGDGGHKKVEDAQARRERKVRLGLQRQQEVRAAAAVRVPVAEEATVRVVAANDDDIDV